MYYYFDKLKEMFKKMIYMNLGNIKNWGYKISCVTIIWN